MYVLGIETSCDETAVAVVQNGNKVLANSISSQVEIHARYGGIVPEVASRQHLISIIPILNQALRQVGLGLTEIGAIAVTNGPGLAGSLIVGVNIAKALALSFGLPIISINHLEAHIYSNWLNTENPPTLPALCLIVSGGHTELVFMLNHGAFKKLGQTKDDAAGEAFDKSARILGLGYPGGPAIEKAAQNTKPSIGLPSIKLRESYDFSLSGLKTALSRLVQNTKPEQFSIKGAASAFQETIIRGLTTRTVEVASEIGARSILLCGGVAANKALRKHLLNASSIPVWIPDLQFCTDNAAMVAACGFFRYQLQEKGNLAFDILPSLSL